MPYSAKVLQWKTLASDLSKFFLLKFSLNASPMIATYIQFIKVLVIKILCRPYSSTLYPVKLLCYTDMVPSVDIFRATTCKWVNTIHDFPQPTLWV